MQFCNIYSSSLTLSWYRLLLLQTLPRTKCSKNKFWIPFTLWYRNSYPKGRKGPTSPLLGTPCKKIGCFFLIFLTLSKNGPSRSFEMIGLILAPFDLIALESILFTLRAAAVSGPWVIYQFIDVAMIHLQISCRDVCRVDFHPNKQIWGIWRKNTWRSLMNNPSKFTTLSDKLDMLSLIGKTSIENSLLTP